MYVSFTSVSQAAPRGGFFIRCRPTGEHHRTVVSDQPQPASSLTKPFDIEELETALGKLKPRKTAGIDDILAEMLQHLGPKAKTWLLKMLNTCMAQKTIPPVWRQAKVVAIPKPAKDPSSPKSYRPISLICITYKLYERLLLQRLMPLIDTKLTKDQAGFRLGHSCARQLLNLTQHIEDGFEGKLITGAAFIDLTAAYDTVQHRTVVRKLLDMTVTLDRTLSYKKHLENTKAKVNARNNILRKLVNSKWGTDTPTIRATAIVLCISTAEYACSSWSRSRHTKLVDTALNDACRIITGCVKSTPIPCLYALAGISPPHIRRLGIAQDEQITQEMDVRHPLHGHIATPRRLRSRFSFVQTVLPLQTTKEAARANIWEDEWKSCDPQALKWFV
ncbi:Hypp2004 [Xyrichtys novacula]|uniref:Hypp2004 n=1 Tax=Xyrichtys novacula TaxID=13765 RepID=A0AAV1FIY0_XYRNO|nr:Hypp2004 [Xyrichtys novacula]